MMECCEHFAFTQATYPVSNYMTCLILGEEEELALQKEVTSNWIVRDWDSNHSNLFYCSLSSSEVCLIVFSH